MESNRGIVGDSRASGRRGFSLVELLVSIGVIGILLALALPSLANARAAARETVALANARTLGMSFQAYCDRFGAYPFRSPGTPVDDSGEGPPLPGDLVAVRWWPRGTIIATSSVWAFAHLWPGLLSEVAPWPEYFATWVSPGRDKSLPVAPDPFSDDEPDREPFGTVSWRYSNSFIGAPQLWREGSVAEGRMLRAIQPHEVLFPSSKVVAWDADITYVPKEPRIVDDHYDWATPMLFADGHGAAKKPTEAKETAPNPMNFGSRIKLHNTVNGVRGVDY